MSRAITASATRELPCMSPSMQCSQPSRRLFSQSRWDAIFVATTLGEVALSALLSLRFGEWSLTSSLALAGVCLVLEVWSFQCAAHYFVHHPFFRSRALNRLFSLMSSITLAVPQSLYRVHHLNHHRYDNAPPTAGRRGDLSSTYRYSTRAGEEESLLAYAFIGPWRADYGFLLAGARRQGDTAQVCTEAAAFALYVITLGVSNWRGALLVLLPLMYLRHVGALAQNYLEHHHARPAGSKLSGAVSSYGAVYNIIACNNGYHQEHHFRPQVHWTQLPGLRSSMLPEAERRVVPYAHFFNVGPIRSGQPGIVRRRSIG